MTRTAHILLLLLGLLGMAGVGGPARAADADPDAVYRIGAGDSVRIRVVGEDDLTGVFLVDASGRLDLPMVGVLPADGLTAMQIGTRLTRVLASDFLVDPQVSVQVEKFASRPVQVLGAVRKPGTYYLEGPTRLLEILAEVGGVLDEKSSSEVRVSGGDGREPVVVDLEALMLSGDGDVVLSAGDVVHVLEGKVIYVNGQVGKPGSVAWKGGITVTRALALAGGAKGTANLRKAYLLRDGQPERLNLRRIFRGKDPDPVLRPGDQLLVGESAL
ncbi:MAG: polysaccharide biosynthesis/export family protein [Myxococcota bacterium]|nr:polysaccharide biosynthesis/export family protein [Myxococcota bacterium]